MCVLRVSYACLAHKISAIFTASQKSKTPENTPFSGVSFPNALLSRELQLIASQRIYRFLCIMRVLLHFSRFGPEARLFVRRNHTRNLRRLADILLRFIILFMHYLFESTQPGHLPRLLFSPWESSPCTCAAYAGLRPCPSKTPSPYTRNIPACPPRISSPLRTYRNTSCLWQ